MVQNNYCALTCGRCGGGGAGQPGAPAPSAGPPQPSGGSPAPSQPAGSPAPSAPAAASGACTDENKSGFTCQQQKVGGGGLKRPLLRLCFCSIAVSVQPAPALIPPAVQLSDPYLCFPACSSPPPPQDWGHCNADFMVRSNYCALTCGRCGGGQPAVQSFSGPPDGATAMAGRKLLARH